MKLIDIIKIMKPIDIVEISAIILLLILLIIVSFFYFRNKYRSILKVENLFDEINQQKKDQWLKDLQEVKDNYHQTSIKLQAEIDRLNNEIELKTQFNEAAYQQQKDHIDRLIEEYRNNEEQRFKTEKSQTDSEIEEWKKSAQEAATLYASMQKQSLTNEISQLQSTLSEYRQSAESVNKEILRSRAIKEKEDFYKIQLPDASKADISYLLTILDKFNNKDIIYKLIWSEYIQQPFKSMVNRILQSRDPKNIIYMIQNIDTNEIYIGKTKSEASKRWTEHIKTSLNIGTSKPKKVHLAMYNNWDKFTFSVLEEVPLDQDLSARESYYINFYQSDIYGYNMIK